MKKIFVLLLCLLILLPSTALQEKRITGTTLYFSNQFTPTLNFDAKQAMRNEENRACMALALALDFEAYCIRNNYNIGIDLDSSSSIIYIGRAPKDEIIGLYIYKPDAQAVLMIVCGVNEEGEYVTQAVGVTGVTLSEVIDSIRATCLDEYYVVNFN